MIDGELMLVNDDQLVICSSRWFIADSFDGNK